MACHYPQIWPNPGAVAPLGALGSINRLPQSQKTTRAHYSRESGSPVKYGHHAFFFVLSVARTLLSIAVRFMKKAEELQGFFTVAPASRREY